MTEILTKLKTNWAFAQVTRGLRSPLFHFMAAVWERGYRKAGEDQPFTKRSRRHIVQVAAEPDPEGLIHTVTRQRGDRFSNEEFVVLGGKTLCSHDLVKNEITTLTHPTTYDQPCKKCLKIYEQMKNEILRELEKAWVV